MKVLHLVHDVRDAGNGIVNVAVDVAIAQAEAGHSAALASGPGALSDLLAANDVGWFDLPLRAKPLNLIRALPKLARIVNAMQPDVVHAHNLAGLLVATPLRAFFHFDLAVTVHRVYDRSIGLMRLADRVIALSEANRQALVASGVRPDRISVVNNGIVGSLRRHRVDGIAAEALAHPAVVTVAGLYRRKGIDILIEAFAQISARYPAAELYIVGDGPDRDAFEELSRSKLCAARIHFAGFQREPGRFMKSADVFVLPSRRESFPLALIEAREARCAIISTDVDGAGEALDDGRAGILVPVEDIDALAAALAKLLDDFDLRRRLQRSAGAGLDRFTVEHMARETIAAYQT